MADTHALKAVNKNLTFFRTKASPVALNILLINIYSPSSCLKLDTDLLGSLQGVYYHKTKKASLTTHLYFWYPRLTTAPFSIP